MIPMNNNLKQPLVSIIVPMYNQQRYVDDCLRSISRQSYKNLEVIVINDGSTDNSPSMVRAWTQKDDRIHLIDKPNEGVTMARRDGLLKATGQFVAFVDSDDLLPSRAIEILVDCINRTGVDLVLGSATKKLGFIHRRGMDRMMTFPCHQVIEQPDLFDKYFVGFFRNNVFLVSMWARLYRKAVIDKAMEQTQLFDKDVNRMGEDQLFNLRLFPFLQSMYRTDQTVYIYRYGGVTNRFNPHFTQLFDSSDKRLKMLDQYEYVEGYQPLFAEYVACLYFHASRLISCEVTDKQGVIDYFRQEMEHRALMPRLLAFYNEHGAPDSRVQMLLDNNYEGMYQCACDLIEQRRSTMKSRIRSWAIRSLMRWS